MARSLELTAYRAYARRSEAQELPAYTPPRPKGEVVWIHAAEPHNFPAIQDFASRLRSQRPETGVIISLQENPHQMLPVSRRDGIVIVSLPNEHPDSIAAFLDHWRPECCLWMWGGLRPNLVFETARRGTVMYLVDADREGFDGTRDRWLTDVTLQMLTKFKKIMVRSDEGMQRLTRLGVPKDLLESAQPLLAGGHALPCAETDMHDLSAALGGRPVWYATKAMPDECSAILKAHRIASLMSHRLLLILQPAYPKDADEMCEAAENDGFNVTRWGDDYPDDLTQVLVADDPADMGLFYRVAPVCFLGSSLVASPDACDPFDAATLGSAVLYGPEVNDFLSSYSRLFAAGGARIVNSADALGAAVSRLIAPDRAATMAHAGWDVISEGAELTDKVVELVQEALDDRANPE